MAEASYHQALAQLAHARLNLQRTRLVLPVNGYVTNLNVQVGDCATTGQSVIAIVDADNFWVDGYFEETFLGEIHPGAPARVKLMGSKVILPGHVVNLARGISVPNAQSDPEGLAAVNPVFTRIRLAQRLPVRVRMDEVPPAVMLAIGRTATVEIVGSVDWAGLARPVNWLQHPRSETQR
jgi:multidrug resistance efflux pump